MWTAPFWGVGKQLESDVACLVLQEDGGCDGSDGGRETDSKRLAIMCSSDIA